MYCAQNYDAHSYLTVEKAGDHGWHGASLLTLNGFAASFSMKNTVNLENLVQSF